MEKQTEKAKNNSIQTTLLVVLVALVSAVLATYAWFSIADNAKLTNMRFDITGGKSLKFDLSAHEKYEDYCSELSFEEIREAVLRETGADIGDCILEPVTTTDGKNFTYENGKEADSANGEYIEFVLHFTADTAMNVYLTSENSDTKEDGTMVISENADVPASLRISFETGGETLVYDPGMDGNREKVDGLTVFGLLPSEKMLYNESNMLFEVPENGDVPVTVRIWCEGTDEACTNEIKESDYAVRLKFEGRAADGKPVE